MITHIAFPIRLEFKPDMYKHTAYIVDTFKRRDNKIRLEGNVKASVGNSYEQAKAEMVKDVVECVITVCSNYDSRVSPSDFSLVFSCNEIIDGKVWGGGGVVSTHQF